VCDLLARFGAGSRRLYGDRDRVCGKAYRRGTRGRLERREVAVMGAEDLFERRRQVLQQMKTVRDLGGLRGIGMKLSVDSLHQSDGGVLFCQTLSEYLGCSVSFS
jgi:hypothetical protein